MISATITGTKEVAEYFRSRPTQIREQLKTTMLRVVIKIQRYVVVEKLEGQALHHRTGNLQRAVVFEVEDLSNGITGTVGVDRTAPYGKVHEYGFQGIVTIREHLATSVLGNQFTVRTHQANMNIPQRAFLRSTLAENEDSIHQSFSDDAVSKSL